MNDKHTRHPLYYHFQQVPYSLRVLFTGTLLVLGLGYLFAMVYIFAAHSGADGQPGLSVEDIKVTYSGNNQVTPLEKALRGPMSGMLPAKDLNALLSWIHQGARKKAYTGRIESIVAERCLDCHDGSNPHLVNLDGYDHISEVVEQDTGEDLFTLVRVSHIHLFGMTFIFFIMGYVFAHAYIRPLWVKHMLILVPFLGVCADVLGWYVTKYFTPFAWVVMLAGAVNGAVFGIMWVISMYQMWFYKLPEHVAKRGFDNVDSR